MRTAVSASLLLALALAAVAIAESLRPLDGLLGGAMQLAFG